MSEKADEKLFETRFGRKMIGRKNLQIIVRIQRQRAHILALKFLFKIQAIYIIATNQNASYMLVILASHNGPFISHVDQSLLLFSNDYTCFDI